MKIVDRLFNKYMTLRTGKIDYMSRNAFHRAMEEYATQPASEQGEEVELLGTNKPNPKKIYFSPNGEKVSICVDGTWKIFSSFPQPEPTDLREKVENILVENEVAFDTVSAIPDWNYPDVLDAISSLLPDVTEEMINETFPLEVDSHGFKASLSYNEYQRNRREGAKAILELFRKEGR